MTYDPNIHHRRSIRLKGYDYSQAGLYFITICTQNRACLFGFVGAPLVGAQNDGAHNDTIQNDGIVQNDGGANIIMGCPQIGCSEIGRPQGHAPTDARNDDDVQNDGSHNDAIQNDGARNNGIVQNETDNGNDDGRQTDATMILNESGKMVETEWLKLTERFSNIELHEFVVMPNHFHGILQIVDVSAVGKTVGDMLDVYKSITTVEYINGVKTKGWQRFNRKLWQRNYWEHIIRDEQSYQRISDYIKANPNKWKDDKFYKQ